MKKTIILFASVLLAIQMQAQVKVGSNGNMMVGLTTGTPLSTLSIGSTGASTSVLNLTNTLASTNNMRDCLNIYRKPKMVSLHLLERMSRLKMDR